MTEKIILFRFFVLLRMTGKINLKGKKLWKILIGIILLLFIVFLVFVIKPYKLENQESVKVYDRYGQILYDVRNEYRQTNYENISEIPEFLIDFLVEKEDKRFWKHNGVDFVAIVRALKSSVMDGNIQGASTINQQVIKLSQNAFERNIWQKLNEIILAWNINLHYSKDEILLNYVNNLYFPNGVRGFQSACKIYFGQSCSDLSNGHLVYLYAKTKYPSKKYLAEYSWKTAQKYGLENYSLEDFEDIEDELGFYTENTARHFVNYIIDETTKRGNGETEIKTDFDSVLYEKIQNVIKNQAAHLDSKDAKNICAIVLQDGKMRSMNIYPDFGKEYINGCLQPRQVGSTIKAFLYTFAFEELDYDANTKISDEAVSFESDYGQYSPQNFDMNYHGEVTLAQALGNSLNIPAVKLLNEVGNENFYYFLSDIGHLVGTEEKWMDDIQQYGLALGLGVKELSPLDFVKMWEVFEGCENGAPVKWSNGQMLDNEKQNENEWEKFCQKYGDELQEVKKILSENQNRLISFGQYNRFDIMGSFGKSGTSRHFIDGWICGGKKNYTVCIWAGNYSTAEMKGGGHEVVGPIWYEVMNLL